MFGEEGESLIDGARMNMIGKFAGLLVGLPDFELQTT